MNGKVYKGMLVVLAGVFVLSLASNVEAARRGAGRRGDGFDAGAARAGQPMLEDGRRPFMGNPRMGRPRDLMGAQGRGRRGLAGRGAGELAMLRRLDLSDEQREAVKEIVESYREQLADAREAKAEAQKALHEAVTGGAGEDAIRSSAADIGVAIGNEAVLRAAMLEDIKAELTEEQLAELEQIKERMQERMEDRRQLREEGGQGARPRQGRRSRGGNFDGRRPRGGSFGRGNM